MNSTILYTFLMLDYFFNQLCTSTSTSTRDKQVYVLFVGREHRSETCAQLSNFYIMFYSFRNSFFKYILLCIKPTIPSLKNVKAQFFPVSATEDMCLTTHSSAWIPETSWLIRMPATTRNRRQQLQAVGAIYYKQQGPVTTSNRRQLLHEICASYYKQQAPAISRNRRQLLQEIGASYFKNQAPATANNRRQLLQAIGAGYNTRNRRQQHPNNQAPELIEIGASNISNVAPELSEHRRKKTTTKN